MMKTCQSSTKQSTQAKKFVGGGRKRYKMEGRKEGRKDPRSPG
jgi:hypothetical protein